MGAKAWEGPLLPAVADVSLTGKEYRFLVGTATGANVAAGATGEPVIGVCEDPQPVAGRGTTIRAYGIAVVEAGAAVAAGVGIASDAQGRAILAVTGKTKCAFSRTAATAAGQLIEVQLGNFGVA